MTVTSTSARRRAFEAKRPANPAPTITTRCERPRPSEWLVIDRFFLSSTEWLRCSRSRPDTRVGMLLPCGRRQPISERPTVDDVEACQVTKVDEEHTTSDDIEKCRPGVVEDPLDGLEDDLGLGLDRFTDDLTLPGGSLAGDEHESAFGDDSRNVWKAGSRLGAEDLHVGLTGANQLTPQQSQVGPTRPRTPHQPRNRRAPVHQPANSRIPTWARSTPSSAFLHETSSGTWSPMNSVTGCRHQTAFEVCDSEVWRLTSVLALMPLSSLTFRSCDVSQRPSSEIRTGIRPADS